MSRAKSRFHLVTHVSASEFMATISSYLTDGKDLGPLKTSWLMNHDPCVYCGSPSNTWDHLEARETGGKDAADNVARSCAACNQAKGKMSVLLFLALRHSSGEYHGRYDVLQGMLAVKRRGLLHKLTRLLAYKIRSGR